VKLGKYASYTCAVLSSACGEESCGKVKEFLSGINGSKRALMSKQQMKIVLITSSLSWILFTLNSFHKASQPSSLFGNTEVVI